MVRNTPMSTGEGVLPVKFSTGRLRPKGVLFSGFGLGKGRDLAY